MSIVAVGAAKGQPHEEQTPRCGAMVEQEIERQSTSLAMSEGCTTTA
jgi:hypothetical protein